MQSGLVPGLLGLAVGLRGIGVGIADLIERLGFAQMKPL